MLKEVEKHFETCFKTTDDVVDVDQGRDKTITRLTTFYTIVNPLKIIHFGHFIIVRTCG